MSGIKYECVPVKSVVEFLTAINGARAEIKKDDSGFDIFYRGEANSEWKSSPSLFRNNKYYQNESIMYEKGLRENRADFRDCKSDFERLTLLQHYGLPTRLMDFTTNPLIALFFACETAKLSDKQSCHKCGNNIEKNGKVLLYRTDHVLDNNEIVQTISEKAFSKDGIPPSSEEKKDYFVQSSSTSARMTHQAGLFLLVGFKENMDDYALDSETGRGEEYRGFCKTFEVESSHKQNILQGLNELGINEAYVYPELEHRFKHLKEQYLLK